MKILIATPAYGGVVHTCYHDSVLKTVKFFAADFPGIEFENIVMSISMLPTARNALASRVLNDMSFTHLLFIDADMGFAPSLIAKMLAFQKPIVGIVAPGKKLDLEAFYRARAACGDTTAARLLANDYVAGGGAVVGKMDANGRKEVDVVDGFVPVNYTGTGVMLIERKVLEIMRDRFPDLWITNPPDHVKKLGVTGGFLQCFEPLHDSHGVTMGEDISFCTRWVTKCGGEIWANIDEAIVHIGNEIFAGQYLNKLQLTDGVKLNIRNSSPSPEQTAGQPAAHMNRKERRAAAAKAG